MLTRLDVPAGGQPQPCFSMVNQQHTALALTQAPDHTSHLNLDPTVLPDVPPAGATWHGGRPHSRRCGRNQPMHRSDGTPGADADGRGAKHDVKNYPRTGLQPIKPRTTMPFAVELPRSQPASAVSCRCHGDQKGLTAFRRSGP